ncbi:MAG TPA: HD domain-containing protein [Gemmataceae bacterium]|jgi:guanosine-3',5'-bis(diphosphate) 3'-pyrophosphohydrolase|nr:HD domain-containing protein [Gemmataceae bacterium]
MSDDFRSLLAAVSFAARAHDGQRRKDGKTPYVAHVMRVALIVRHKFGFDDPEMLEAALLHDTMEDTTTDFDDVAQSFSPAVASWAAALSKDKRLPEEAREKAYVAVLRNAPWQVQVCKLADVYDNTIDSAHLDAKGRTRTLTRMRMYLTALSDSAHSEVQRCWKIVDELVTSVGG